MTEITASPELYISVLIASGIFLFLLLLKFALFINDFSKTLKYLNSEIRRTKGEEQNFWIYCRRRLWFSVIPFVKH